MAESSEELSKRMELLTKTFLETFATVGEQLKGLQEALSKNNSEVKEVIKEQKEQGMRIAGVEEKAIKSDKRMNAFEDRLRRANLRLRGFKGEFANNRNMIENIWQWLQDFGIQIENNQLERAHWLLGARRPGGQRDIIVKFTSERTAELVYKELRKITDLNWNGAPVRVLRDLSRETLQARAELNPIAAALFKAKIRFSWGYPCVIIVYQDGKMFRARDLDEGRNMLAELGVGDQTSQTSQSKMVEEKKKAQDAQEKEGAAAGGDKTYQELFKTFSSIIPPLVEKSAISTLEKKLVEDPFKMEQRVTRQKKK